jgi:hypothetical protein
MLIVASLWLKNINTFWLAISSCPQVRAVT